MFNEDERDALEEAYLIEELEKLGEGSFGRVYKAVDLNDDSLCAVKVCELIIIQVISKALIRDALLEQSILQSLHHPHIIRFRRVHENKSNVYMIMELMEGGSL